MVLTNFELWAADGSSALNRPLELETSAHNRHLNPFDPRAVPAQLNSNVTQHLSSNGYYGFSYVNAAHNDIEDSINNNNNNNNINTNNNNNNTSTYNFMANDVNGMSMTTMTTTTPQTHAVSANNSDSDCAVNAAGHAANVTRCKKRFFVMNDADDCTASNNKNHNGSDIFAKRCRFDDDFAAQYCNDFFSMPSTQIATQSCLMDTEEVIQTQPQQQQQYFPPIQQQVDEAMFDNNNNNTEKYELNSHLQLQHEQQQQQSQMQTATTNAQLTPPPPTTQHQQLAAQSSPQQQHLYHQQQHYQDKCHLHNSCDTLSCNCRRTCKIDTQNSENFIKSHNLKKINENVANDFKVDDATLFAQLHGGCWHHFVNNNNTITSNNSNNNKNVVKHY